MDGTRFDSFTRLFAAKLSRRNAVRGGAGLTGAMLGLGGLAVSSAAADSGRGRYTVVRTYQSSSSATDIKHALTGLLPEMAKIPGFIDYSVINGSGDFYLT